MTLVEFTRLTRSQSGHNARFK